MHRFRTSKRFLTLFKQCCCCDCPTTFPQAEEPTEPIDDSEPVYITLTSSDLTKSYDGTQLSGGDVTITSGSLVEGDEISFNLFGANTLVGSSANSFDYTLVNTSGTEYIITKVYGTITVTDEDVEPNLVITVHDYSDELHQRTYTLGETVTFIVSVTNIYDEAKTINLATIAGVTLTRSSFTNVSAGETVLTTAIYTITEPDIFNESFTVTVSATEGTLTKTAEDTINVESPNPSLYLEIVESSTPANNETYALGERINYQITVTNTGNVTVTQIELANTIGGSTWFIDSLSPESHKTFSSNYSTTERDILNGVITETVSATAYYPEGEVDNIESASVDVPTDEPNPEITVISVTKNDNNNTITFTYQNTGNLTLRNVSVEIDANNQFVVSNTYSSIHPSASFSIANEFYALGTYNFTTFITANTIEDYNGNEYEVVINDNITPIEFTIS